MKSKEIRKELNSLIEENKDKYNEDFIKKSIHFILNILKIPLDYISKFSKKELLKVIKKDIKLLMLIGLIIGAIAIFFLVLWFSISVLIGTYFYDLGYSLFNSVLFSVLFQLCCIVLVALIGFIASKQLKSVKYFYKLRQKFK